MTKQEQADLMRKVFAAIGERLKPREADFKPVQKYLDALDAKCERYCQGTRSQPEIAWLMPDCPAVPEGEYALHAIVNSYMDIGVHGWDAEKQGISKLPDHEERKRRVLAVCHSTGGRGRNLQRWYFWERMPSDDAPHEEQVRFDKAASLAALATPGGFEHYVNAVCARLEAIMDAWAKGAEA